MLFLFLLVVMYVIAKFKQLNSFLKYSFVFSGVYFLFYLLFFFQVFSVHDYYLNNLMIFPAITFMCFAHIASESEWMTSNRSFAWIAVIAITFFNSFHVAAVYRMRMIEDDKMVYWFPFISEEEKNLAKYLFWDYGNSIKKIENITGDLREHGIKREDFVLSIPDQSFDISLYFMDQKGFTIARDHIMNDPTVAEKFMNRNIKYVVLSDTTVKTSEAYRQIEYRLERVFVKNGVEVLRLK